MSSSHINWLDFSDTDQVDWAIGYLYRKGFPEADETFLEKLMSPKLNAYSSCGLNSSLELHKIRANMENAWRVNRSRQKNLRKNSRYISVSAETQKSLKRLSTKIKMPVSELVNELSDDLSELEAKARNEIQILKQEHRAKLKEACAQTEMRVIRRITKQLKLQSELIRTLRDCISDFSNDNRSDKANTERLQGKEKIAVIQEVAGNLEKSILDIQKAVSSLGQPDGRLSSAHSW